ncbi:FtsX-like permease family protein [Herbidospora sp. RD11066]
MSAVVAALRIARRNAWREKGRSLLIMVMIGLPVLVITGLLVAYATSTLTIEESMANQIGAADAQLTRVPEGTTFDQKPDGSFIDRDPDPRPPADAAEVVALLGPGTRLVPYGVGDVRLPTGPVTGIETDLRDPLTLGILTLSEGRHPGPGEVAVTPALGLRLGDTLRPVGAAPLKVVGLVDHPHRPTILQVVGPRLPLAPPDELWAPRSSSSGWLADTPRPISWADVTALNKVNVSVTSRATLLDLRATPIGARDIPNTVGLAAVVVMGILVTVLLAGPAFAVGLRRRRRELAEIAAQGGSAGHLRLIVLVDGALLGGLATIAATGLGIAGGLLAVPVIGRLGGTVGPPEIPWASVLDIAALGLVTGMVAALVPAVQAGRQHTATVLAGCAPVASGRRGQAVFWPVIGVVLVLAGLAASVVARRQSAPMWSFTASVPIVLGLVVLTPWLIRFTGRLAPRLRVPLRVAVRDAVRNRSRTVSAVAAVMAVTATAVAVGIAFESQRQDNRDSYTSARPIGSLAIWGGTMPDTTWARFRAEVVRRLPGVPLASGYRVYDAEGRRYALRYTTRWNGIRTPRAAAVGGQDLLRFLQGRHDPMAAEALASGKAVVFDPSAVRDGTFTLRASVASHPDRRIVVPAVVAAPADEHQGGALLPRSLVEQNGFSTVERALYAMHTVPRESTLFRDLSKVSDRVTYAGEPGAHEGSGLLWLWVGLGAAVILVLGGTLAATRLAAADMRPERSTMTAIGASPWTLRAVVAGQALFIAGLGAAMGLAAGAVTGVALSRPMTSDRVGDPATIALPWAFLLAVVVGLPLLAGALALITRTRPLLTRRLS